MATILVLDDDRSLLPGLEGALTAAGDEVRLAGSVQAALSALERASFDLVLTELIGSRPTRLDTSTVHLLRHRAPQAKLIVFTAHPQARRLDARALGVAAVVAKSAGLDELIAAIGRALEPGGDASSST